MTIADGEMVAIVGPSGIGKSTIMNMITGIDRPTAGKVTVRGERVDLMTESSSRSGAATRGRRVSVLPAAPDAHRRGERDAAARLRAARLQARPSRACAARPRAPRSGRDGRPPAVGD